MELADTIAEIRHARQAAVAMRHRAELSLEEAVAAEKHAEKLVATLKPEEIERAGLAAAPVPPPKK